MSEFSEQELIDLRDAVNLFLTEMTGAMPAHEEERFERLHEKLRRKMPYGREALDAR